MNNKAWHKYTLGPPKEMSAVQERKKSCHSRKQKLTLSQGKCFCILIFFHTILVYKSYITNRT